LSLRIATEPRKGAAIARASLHDIPEQLNRKRNRFQA
jgi:hypothetical protein